MHHKILFSFLFVIGLSMAACDSPERHAEDSSVTDQHQEMPDQTQQTSVELSDSEMDEFLEVNEIAMERQVDPTTDGNELESILEDKEMDADRYHEIIIAVQQDPALQQQLRQRMQERMEGSPEMDN